MGALLHAREIPCLYAPKTSKNQDLHPLDECRKFAEGAMSREQLHSATVKLGFVNVIDAFHVVTGDEVPLRFFTDERKSGKPGIRLTDSLLQLVPDFQYRNLPAEVEARWRLVETAWELNLPTHALTVDVIPEDWSVRPTGRRATITGCREALNGYQKGRCFYCYDRISVAGSGSECLADVDHVFPHVLATRSPGAAHPIDGIWNLVLACKQCNRGDGGKFERAPDLNLVQHLHDRNEYLIASYHPLRETLMAQTGDTQSKRLDRLKLAFTEARQVLLHTWKPRLLRGEPTF